MARGKKSKGKNYVSKGERPSVNQKTLNMVRKHRNSDPLNNVKAMVQSDNWRKYVISRKKDPKLAKLRERYLSEEAWNSTASYLFDKYSKFGATWAACYQAAKTDWVSEFENKWIQKKNLKK